MSRLTTKARRSRSRNAPHTLQHFPSGRIVKALGRNDEPQQTFTLNREEFNFRPDWAADIARCNFRVVRVRP